MDSDTSTQKVHRRYTTRDVFGVSVAFVLGLLAVGSWRAYFDVTVNPDVRNTVTALFWFSFLGGIFFLGTAVWKVRFSQAVAPVLVFLPSFLFVQTLYHTIFVLIGIMLGYLSVRFVHDEVEDRVQFHFFRNVKSGAFVFVLALSFTLSSAYFSSIRTESWEALVPRFNIGEGTATALIKTVAYLNPQWKELADTDMSVDGFLLSIQKNEQNSKMPTEQSGIDPAALPAVAEYLRQTVPGSEGMDQNAVEQELYLRSGRQQIAQLVGRSVTGEEKITDVFSSAIQHKVVTVLSGEQASEHFSPTIVPLILALLLFFTLLTIGAVVGYLWIGLGFFFFRVAIFFGWIKMERIMREQEVMML